MLKRNVLIFHAGALGDFVVSWPLAMACGRVMPQSRVIYVTAGQKGKLAEHVLGVESIDAEAGYAALWHDASGASESVRKVMSGAAMIFSFGTAEGDRWSSSASALAPEARRFHLTTKLPAEYSNHVSHYLVEQIASSQPAMAGAVGQMVDSLARRGFGSRTALREGVLLHPGSGAERKNWPRDRFLALADALRKSGHTVRIMLGEVEREKWGAKACDEFSQVGTVVQPTTLIELAKLLAGAAVVVCNDSGPAHVAAAVGAPTVAIFGPTSNAAQWRPAGPAVSVITVPSLDELGTGRVLQEVNAFLALATVGPRSEATPSSDE